MWSLLPAPFSLLPKVLTQGRRERIEQCRNYYCLLGNENVRKSLTAFEASGFHHSERAGMSRNVLIKGENCDDLRIARRVFMIFRKFQRIDSDF